MHTKIAKRIPTSFVVLSIDLPTLLLIMADKEATVYIVDVGVSMGERRNGRDQSDLDFAMTYVWDKITSTVSRVGACIYLCTLTVQGCSRSKDGNAGSNWPSY